MRFVDQVQGFNADQKTSQFHHKTREKHYEGISWRTFCIMVPQSWEATCQWYSSQRTFMITITIHYCDVIMGEMASQITSLAFVYSTVYSDADQRKHQSSASLAFVRGIHWWPVNSPHKWPVTERCFHLMTSSWLDMLLDAAFSYKDVPCTLLLRR